VAKAAASTASASRSIGTMRSCTLFVSQLQQSRALTTWAAGVDDNRTRHPRTAACRRTAARFRGGESGDDGSGGGGDGSGSGGVNGSGGGDSGSGGGGDGQVGGICGSLCSESNPLLRLNEGALSFADSAAVVTGGPKKNEIAPVTSACS